VSKLHSQLQLLDSMSLLATNNETILGLLSIIFGVEKISQTGIKNFINNE
jgi:hypothetical protein